MMKIALVVLTTILGVSAVQAADNPWPKWIVDATNAIKSKEDGIRNMAVYRDSACPALTDPSKSVCAEMYNVIIARRGAEKQQLAEMILIANVSTADERNRLLAVQIPAYQTMDADTTKMADQTMKTYPSMKQSSR